jgi:hypothetical protein
MEEQSITILVGFYYVLSFWGVAIHIYIYIYCVDIYIERSVFVRARFEPPRFAPTSPCLRFPPLRPVPDSVMNGHEFYESSPGIVSYPLVN